MSDDLIKYVLYLINSKKGDVGRLNYILATLQDDKPLYTSDKKYLESMISTYIGPARRKLREQQTVEELRTELTRVNDKLKRIERRGYEKPVGRKAVFFFVTFFFGWHAVTQLVSNVFLQDIQNISPYLFPLFQLKFVMPSQIGFSIEQIVVLVWGGMMLTWIILGFAYLVKFIRSRYNPAYP